jgi:predicted porin
LETRDDLTVGLAYNHANIDGSDLPKLNAYGITGDAQAASLGIRWFSENWYLATVVARLKNHETTNDNIYFEGRGWEVYGQYNVYKQWWAVAGWNILEPDEDQVQAGEFNTKYGVIGVRYSFDDFRQMLFANARLDSGNKQNGTSLGNIYTIGVRWDLP